MTEERPMRYWLNRYGMLRFAFKYGRVWVYDTPTPRTHPTDKERRQHTIDQTNAAYAALKADPAAWQEDQAERAAWEATLADGLPDD